MIKGDGLIRKALEKHPKVEAYDNWGTDPGHFILTLVKGWAFDDAAPTLADDPDGAMACHSHCFASVKAAVERIKSASPCKCGRCSA